HGNHHGGVSRKDGWGWPALACRQCFLSRIVLITILAKGSVFFPATRIHFFQGGMSTRGFLMIGCRVANENVMH
ncbi:hypothetical protein LRB11_06645, partial [Ectothiorhodospira haloalkaliphila]|uniref:hypothetical protein n=1 Tax=Ectothiorhodospira haloalkaliphila TaxID=421628 RepID=UPI001EE783D3